LARILLNFQQNDVVIGKVSDEDVRRWRDRFRRCSAAFFMGERAMRKFMLAAAGATLLLVTGLSSSSQANWGCCGYSGGYGGYYGGYGGYSPGWGYGSYYGPSYASYYRPSYYSSYYGPSYYGGFYGSYYRPSYRAYRPYYGYGGYYSPWGYGYRGYGYRGYGYRGYGSRYAFGGPGISIWW
jgi:hypothetical protein